MSINNILKLWFAKNLKGVCHDHDWLMQNNYHFCLVQNMGLRVNLYGSKNSRRSKEKSQNNGIQLQMFLFY